MQAKADAQLLRDYSESGNETAFTEIVARHTNLVYSAALRQVESPDLAAEVSQRVFIGLARGAPSLAPRLTDDASLAGWLCRSARNISLNLRRDNFRRQSRERQAMDYAEPTPDNVPDWEQLRPVLDEAMSELNEPEYDALVMRFYQNQDLRAVGRALGVSDDAAQKRVTRALDKLRDLLSRRGITTTAGGLSIVLAANAVQAAPVGLAATLSAVALPAGAAASTSTAIAATKTIVMTTLQKTIIGATLVAAVGTGVFEAYQASRLREQNETLRQQQAPLTAQLQQIQRERDDATNRLAALNEAMMQLKSAQQQAEVLRLRGQVGTLRQQLASSDSNANSSSGFAKMMSDPAMRDYIHQAGLDLFRRRYGSLFQELKLTPEQIDQFMQAMGGYFQKSIQKLSALQQGTASPAAPGQGAADEAELERQVGSVLGETGLARFKEYNQEIPARTTIELLNTQLGANKLSAEQGARLFQLVKAEPFELTHGISGDIDKAFFGSQQDIADHLSKVAESNQRVIQQAGNFLSPEQVAALDGVLSNGITARVAQGAAFIRKP